MVEPTGPIWSLNGTFGSGGDVEDTLPTGMKYLPGSSESVNEALSPGFTVLPVLTIGSGSLPLRARRREETIVRPRSAAPPRFSVVLDVVTVTVVVSGR